MTYDPRSVANYIITVRRHFGYETTPLELQKLLFFCHGMHLVRYDSGLVDGYFEAWEHGPVHPYVYKQFKEFGRNPISSKAYETNLITGEKRIVSPPEDPTVRSLIAEIILQLRDLTASQLRDKSHAVGGPWHSVMESAKINLASSVRIPDNVIKELYHRQISAVDIGKQNRNDLEDNPPESYGHS